MNKSVILTSTMNDESSCKYFLYRTIGSSDQTTTETGFKVFDIVNIVPSLLFLMFLLYSLPRTKQKLSGAPILFTSVHWLLHITTVSQIVRCLLMFMAPSPNTDTTSQGLEKFTWSFVHGTNLCLELAAFLIFILPVLPSNRSSHRILGIIGGMSLTYAILMAIVELNAPDEEFHVMRNGLDTNLFGDGGSVFILIFSLSSAVAYSSLISLRVFQKSGSRRSSTFTYSIVLLGVQGTRTLGGILLAADVKVQNTNMISLVFSTFKFMFQFGMCLTNLTLFLLIQFLPPLVFLCVLCPYLQSSQSHSLLNQGGSFRSVGVTEDEDWLEDDYDLYTAAPTSDPLNINR